MDLSYLSKFWEKCEGLKPGTHFFPRGIGGEIHAVGEGVYRHVRPSDPPVVFRYQLGSDGKYTAVAIDHGEPHDPEFDRFVEGVANAIDEGLHLRHSDEGFVNPFQRRASLRNASSDGKRDDLVVVHDEEIGPEHLPQVGLNLYPATECVDSKHLPDPTEAKGEYQTAEGVGSASLLNPNEAKGEYQTKISNDAVFPSILDAEEDLAVLLA